MLYELDRNHYCSFDTIEVNKLAPRAYFIPFSSMEEAQNASLEEKRYISPKVKCLNGLWDFRFYPEPKEVPELFDTDAEAFESIDVPACWQFRGYGKPFYVNARYQFPYNPPKIPTVEAVDKTFCLAGSDYGIKPRWQKAKGEYNFVGVYRKKFEINRANRWIISFLGVASCLELYVNGSFVGYSEGSHNTAEFEITDYCHEGENELLAVVRRWCSGTYLECQDMFRNTGIFRDVLLYELWQNDIYDYAVKTPKTGDTYGLSLELDVLGNCLARLTLRGNGLDITKEFSCRNGKGVCTLEGLQVEQWNAEKPVLYDLFIETPGCCVRHRIGFKSINIQGDVFTLNGEKIKLKGVNHHDTSPTNGYYLTPGEILRDVKLCKDYNMNAIRTSHYPPDPLLLEACDEYGLYVIDEADIETHGTFTMQIPSSYNSLSHDIKWQPHFLDRVRRLYGRDKNRTSIILWSLGNESGGYRNTDACYEYLKAHSDIPVHYEGVIHSARTCYDVGSEMYPTVENVHAVGLHKRRQKQLNDRPYLMCEYAHAMGVGPGGVEEYWQEIYNFDNLMGGCVWEMADHAVLEKDGSYTYGGDHGEYMHDSNFCVDGLFYPDRSPSTGAKIIRHVYRPIRIRHLQDNRFEAFNTLSFTDSTGFTVCAAYPDGSKEPVALNIGPMSKGGITLQNWGKGLTDVVFIVSDVEGREVSREQIVFSIPVHPIPELFAGLPMGLDMVDGKLIYTKGDKCLRVSDPYTILYRVPTDNDRDFALNTAMDDFIPQKEEIIQTLVGNSHIQVKTKISCRKQTFLCTDTYESCEAGVLVTSKLKCIKGGGKLPRFGKAFYLDGSFSEVTYTGRNGESYRDMKEHTQIETVKCKVSDMVEPNIKPQESGNRCDCTQVTLTDGETEFSVMAVDAPFELGIKPYSDKALLSMKHRSDETPTGTYLTVSAFQMGIGTGSCGPATRDAYTFDAKKEYTLRFILS
ncbi:MAG: glycoside hydrolase family 2 TIM barrel-domain containing protein [Faecousia sp.]